MAEEALCTPRVCQESKILSQPLALCPEDSASLGASGLPFVVTFVITLARLMTFKHLFRNMRRIQKQLFLQALFRHKVTLGICEF